MTHWSMVGWSHHRTPLEIRERLAFSQDQAQAAQRRLADEFPQVESVLLSTCNRVELYCAANQADQLPPQLDLAKFLSDFHQLDFSLIGEQLSSLDGAAAIKHLFMVASSLDSMIVGEAQILSQVKASYESACQGGFAAALMHLAFQRASGVARRVANETEIHRRRISVPSVAVSEIAADFFERFDDKQILLIGAGEMGTETLRYLIDAGARSLRVVNRNRDRGEELARQFQAQAYPWDELEANVARADLIVSTTSAREPVMTLDRFKACRDRHASAVLILDLAVPRDFDPAIAALPDVYLFTVDDLQQVCDRNMVARRAEWPKAERIIDQEVDRFLNETAHRSSGPTIKRLREQAEQLKQEELERLLNRLRSRGIDPATEKELGVAFDRLVNKLLHAPLQSLRDHADSSHHATLLDALRRLFHIKD